MVDGFKRHADFFTTPAGSAVFMTEIVKLLACIILVRLRIENLQ